MLFDPKWETKADPLSLSSLIAWLEMQPGDKTYDAGNPHECLLAQWAKSMDATAYCPGEFRDPWSSYKYMINGKLCDMSPYRDIAVWLPKAQNFGAALGRARELRYATA